MVLALAGVAAAPASAHPNCGSTGAFSSSGGVAKCTYLEVGPDTFTVPVYRTTMTFDVFGAGGMYPCTEYGGEGKGDLAVTSFQQFQINVGGAPRTGSDGTPCALGGWNGGGNGGSLRELTVYGGSAGSGASDVRTGAHGLSDRLVVGGGSGGSFVDYTDHSRTPQQFGKGGGEVGDDGGNGVGTFTTAGGKGGTQSAGGASSGDASSAGFGFGGSGGQGFLNFRSGGAGGGGGWYGGGGSGSVSGGPGNGGGGSGHVTPFATNASLRTGVPAPDQDGVQNTGRGEVVVSWDNTPITAAVTVTSNKANPIDPSALVRLTAHVDTSTGAAPVGLVILVSNGKYNLGSGYVDGNGDFTLAKLASNLPVADNNVVATFYDWYGVIADASSSGLDVQRDRLNQTIEFDSTAPSPATAGGATYSVSATASSGLPVTYLIPSASSSVCSISGTTVTFLAQGSCVIEADQGGDGTYKPAPSEQQTVDVVWGSSPIPITATVFGVQSQGGTPHFFYT
ncbi:MAG TPA: glycine-rich protein, partial [Gaiellaceae bacterium]